MLQSYVWRDIVGVLQRGARTRTYSGDPALRDLLYQVYIRLLLGKYALKAAICQIGRLALWLLSQEKISFAKTRR